MQKSSNILSVTALIAFSILVYPNLLFAEGSANFGPEIGLNSSTILYVRIEQPGERILICSSDDGRQEGPVQTVALDAEPGASVEYAQPRPESQIIVYPPTNTTLQYL